MNQAQYSKRPIKVVIAYCSIDKESEDKLITWLQPLVKDERIALWSPSSPFITAGTVTETEISSNFNQADIILALISQDFIACSEVNNYNRLDVQRRIIAERINNNSEDVVPIILRPSAIADTEFYELWPLPESGKPISSYTDAPEWPWLNIYNGIKLIIDKKPRSLITMSGLQDFFCEEDINSDSSELRLFPILKDVNDTFVEPSFFDCMCLSLKELSNVVLISGSVRSGKSTILNRAEEIAGLPQRSWYKKYSCFSTQQKNELLNNINSINEGIIIVDDFEFLSPVEQSIIIRYSLELMNSCQKTLLVISGRLELEGSLAKLIRNQEYHGLYDQYHVNFSTYDSNQILQVFSRIKERFKIEIKFSKREDVSRYSVNSIFIARCLCYHILKSHLDKKSYPKEINFEDATEKIFNQMQVNGYFLTFETIEKVFVEDNTYRLIFVDILCKISEVSSKGFVSLKKLLSKSCLNLYDVNKFVGYAEGHIAEISYEHPGFFDYEKNTQQISICNIEFLFYLKHKYRISITANKK